MMMPILILLLVFGAYISLSAQEAPRDSDDRGPWKVGECVAEEDLESGFPSTYWFRVVGNSFYKRENRRSFSCFLKLAELPITVCAVERAWEGEGEVFRLWTGEGEYRYVVKTGLLERVDAIGTLSSFLVSPITRVEARSKTVVGIAGITESSYSSTHQFGSDDTTQPLLRHEVRVDDSPSRSGAAGGVDVESLTWALRSVNADSHHLPSLAEFDFDDADVLAYRERVATDIRETGSVEPAETWELYEKYYREYLPTVDRRDVFADLPSQIDAVSGCIVAASLLHTLRGGCGYHFEEITFVNEEGDSLVIYTSSSPYGPRPPLGLPWTIRYGESEFRTFSVELACLLMQLLPNEYRSEREEKVDLLYAVAWQLGEMRK